MATKAKAKAKVQISGVEFIPGPTLNVEPGELVKLPPWALVYCSDYNIGREDRWSWGNPIREYTPSLSEGWDPARGAIAAYRLIDAYEYEGEDPLPRDSVHAALEARIAWYNALREGKAPVMPLSSEGRLSHLCTPGDLHGLSPEAAALAMEGMYTNGQGQWFLPELWAIVGHRRSHDLPFAVAYAKRERGANAADYTLPVDVSTFGGVAAAQDRMRRENRVRDKQAYSDVGKLTLAVSLASRIHSESELAREVECKNRGESQKIFWTAKMAVRNPSLRLIPRIVLGLECEEAERAKPEAERQEFRFAPGGPILWRRINATEIAALQQIPPKKGEAARQTRQKYGVHEGVASPDIVEKWLADRHSPDPTPKKMGEREMDTLVSDFNTESGRDVVAPIWETVQAVRRNDKQFFSDRMPKG